MSARLTHSTACHLLTNERAWLLVLALLRVQARRAEQLRLKLKLAPAGREER